MTSERATAGGPPWVSGVSELRWGLKRSFLDYLSGLADFDLAMVSARALPQDQAFAFPVVGEWGGGVHPALRFGGVLVFTAHFGALRVVVAEPWLESAPGGARLTVARPQEWGAGPDRLALADLTPAGVLRRDEWVLQRFDAVLAAGGVAMFAGVYVPGEPLEPVVVVARAAEQPRHGGEKTHE